MAHHGEPGHRVDQQRRPLRARLRPDAPARGPVRRPHRVGRGPAVRRSPPRRAGRGWRHPGHAGAERARRGRRCPRRRRPRRPGRAPCPPVRGCARRPGLHRGRHAPREHRTLPERRRPADPRTRRAASRADRRRRAGTRARPGRPRGACRAGADPRGTFPRRRRTGDRTSVRGDPDHVDGRPGAVGPACPRAGQPRGAGRAPHAAGRRPRCDRHRAANPRPAGRAGEPCRRSSTRPRPTGPSCAPGCATSSARRSTRPPAVPRSTRTTPTPPTCARCGTPWQRLGFTGGQVLEPGSGIGTFIGLAPDGAAHDRRRARPASPPRSRRPLYPDASIRTESFADTRLPAGYFDLAVGNVPFADVRCTTRRTTARGTRIHNHFIIKSLHLTRPAAWSRC